MQGGTEWRGRGKGTGWRGEDEGRWMSGYIYMQKIKNKNLGNEVQNRFPFFLKLILGTCPLLLQIKT